MSASDNCKNFKILLLHGKGENGPSFRSRISKFVDLYPEVHWEFATAPHLIGDSNEFAWWKLPPNVRSFEAQEYIGIDHTFQSIEQVWKDKGPFDAVLGYSQGAILISAMLAKAALEDFCFKPQFAILVGAAWPQPFDALMTRLESAGGPDHATGGRFAPKTLHVISPQDRVNPPVMAARIRKLMGPGSSEYPHSFGHTVPLDGEGIAAMAGFLGLPARSP